MTKISHELSELPPVRFASDSNATFEPSPLMETDELSYTGSLVSCNRPVPSELITKISFVWSVLPLVTRSASDRNATFEPSAAMETRSVS